MDKKERLGDWECDTVIGKDHKSVLVTVVDRALIVYGLLSSLEPVSPRGESRHYPTPSPLPRACEDPHL